MEKVRLWCGQPPDGGWLKNRTTIISVCLWLSFCQLDSTKNEGSVFGPEDSVIDSGSDMFM